MAAREGATGLVAGGLSRLAWVENRAYRVDHWQMRVGDDRGVRLRRFRKQRQAGGP